MVKNSDSSAPRRDVEGAVMEKVNTEKKEEQSTLQNYGRELAMESAKSMKVQKYCVWLQEQPWDKRGVKLPRARASLDPHHHSHTRFFNHRFQWCLSKLEEEA